MADVTNELIYEVLKHIQADVATLKESWRENTAALNAVRTHIVGLQHDVTNVYAILARQDVRLDRIERRLDITEVV